VPVGEITETLKGVFVKLWYNQKETLAVDLEKRGQCGCIIVQNLNDNFEAFQRESVPSKAWLHGMWLLSPCGNLYYVFLG
jgi:hypothetical protein